MLLALAVLLVEVLLGDRPAVLDGPPLPAQLTGESGVALVDRDRLAGGPARGVELQLPAGLRVDVFALAGLVGLQPGADLRQERSEGGEGTLLGDGPWGDQEEETTATRRTTVLTRRRAIRPAGLHVSVHRGPDRRWSRAALVSSGRGRRSMRIRPFGVEQWINAYETRCRLNLAETCVESLTVAELLGLAGAPPDALSALLPLKLTYGAIEGSDRLGAAIAALYASQAPSSVLVAHGAIGANALLYQALVEPGDRVVSLVPTYQQHTAIPESLGADVRAVPLREAQRFQPDLDAVREALGGAARLLVFANPNNPTGALVDTSTLTALARLAEAAGAYILCDEVYRGLTQQGDALTPSVADLSPRYRRGQHVQGLLAGRPAPRLDGRAARGARCRRASPGLFDDQRRHGRRPLRGAGPGAPRRRAGAQPRRGAGQPHRARRLGEGRARRLLRQAPGRVRPRSSRSTCRCRLASSASACSRPRGYC